MCYSIISGLSLAYSQQIPSLMLTHVVLYIGPLLRPSSMALWQNCISVCPRISISLWRSTQHLGLWYILYFFYYLITYMLIMTSFMLQLVQSIRTLCTLSRAVQVFFSWHSSSICHSLHLRQMPESGTTRTSLFY